MSDNHSALDANTLFTELTETGALKETARGEVALSPAFVDTARVHRGSPSEDFPGDDSLAKEYDDIASYFTALAEWTDLPPERRLQVAATVGQLDGRIQKTAGAPDPCFPIAGSDVRLFTQLFDPSLIYFWREDCPPCDTMRTELESLLDSHPDIGMFAVYGPQWVTALKEEFNVIGAPTLLFASGGTIDARLLGAQYREAIERELNAIKA
jgi:thiol-disulfide isomerase/thioredoxin